MTRTEYMAQLEKYLKKLPHKEYQEAIGFFKEYFDEAGPEREAYLIEELGTPKEAANELINNMLNRQVEEAQEDQSQPSKEKMLFRWFSWLAMGVLFTLSLLLLLAGEFLGYLMVFLLLLVGAFFLGKNINEWRKTRKTLWLAILAVATLPITLPLLLLLLLLLLGLIAVIIVFLLAAFGLGICLTVLGAYLIWEAFTLLPQAFSVFLMGFGGGLSLIGGAILLYILTGYFAYWSGRFVKTFFQWILKRGKTS